MATTALSIVDRVRQLLGDYVQDTTQLSAALTDTTGTTLTVADGTVMTEGDWATVDFETMEVTKVLRNTITVRRGAKGSLAATHLIDAPIRVNYTFPPHVILQAVNESLADAYPQLYKDVTDTSTVVVQNQDLYNVPATMEYLVRVEVQAYTQATKYIPFRAWDFADTQHFRLYGMLPAGLGLRLVGMARFDTLLETGSLDATFPDANASAVGYLVWDAAGRLLMSAQATRVFSTAISTRSGYATDQPYLPMNTGQAFRKQAADMLFDAKMKRPLRLLPDPARMYYSRP